ncbi:hypothetical protein ABW20_dc0106800 [Dactylellina cionopaga]|nr:hypothetical protein ABW20_dc0106800 [Dactylellina cionopaga]
MLHQFSRIFFCGLLFGGLVTAVPVAEISNNEIQLEERNACNADNLLRLVRGTENLSQGLEFCSSWLGKNSGTQTETVFIATVTPTATLTTVSVSTSTAILTSTETITNTGSTTVTATSTRTRVLTVYVWKRAATKKPLSEQILSTYPASRISSACNCLTFAPAVTTTAYLTSTAAAVTSYSTLPSVTGTSVTVTLTNTATTVLTSVSTVTATTIIYTYIPL